MIMPKVSVIVPNYNHAPYLQQRIESILNQTYHDFELIILDDCSIDNSRDIIEQYKNNPKTSQIIYNEKNSGGVFIQWNKGIELAQGEYIWIAESDDFADPFFLEELIKQSDKYKDAGLLYSHLRWVDVNGVEKYSQDNSDEIIYYSGNDFIQKKLLYTTTIFNVSSAIFSRDLYEKIDKSLYEKMKLCGDYFFYVLLAEKTNVVECCKVLASFRTHDSNTSTKLSLQGADFIEGIKILDYIISNYKVKPLQYALHYARLWKKHIYTKTVNQNVRKVFWKNHKLIVIYYYCLIFWNKLKKYGKK